MGNLRMSLKNFVRLVSLAARLLLKWGMKKIPHHDQGPWYVPIEGGAILLKNE